MAYYVCVANSKSWHAGTDCYDGGAIRVLAILFNHLLTTIAKLMRPGGGRTDCSSHLSDTENPVPEDLLSNSSRP